MKQQQHCKGRNGVRSGLELQGVTAAFGRCCMSSSNITLPGLLLSAGGGRKRGGKADKPAKHKAQISQEALQSGLMSLFGGLAGHYSPDFS